MITVYGIDNKGIHNKKEKQITLDDGIDKNWTRIEPPVYGQNKYAYFDGSKWFILDQYPAHPTDFVTNLEMRQYRLELNARGELQNFETALSNAPNSTELIIDWEYSTEVKFGGVFKEILKTTLNLDDDGYRQFFISASQR